MHIADTDQAFIPQFDLTIERFMLLVSYTDRCIIQRHPSAYKSLNQTENFRFELHTRRKTCEYELNMTVNMTHF